jgi:hypothetical protein
MRESNWEVMDKDQIIELIIKHNAGVDVTPEIQRRIKNKLDNMDAVELWSHIRRVYGGILYEPEKYTVTDDDLRERKLKARELDKARRVVRPIVVNPPVLKEVAQIPVMEQAYNDIYNISCVDRVYDYHDGKLVVLMADKSMIRKLRRWIGKHYPTVQVVIIGED